MPVTTQEPASTPTSPTATPEGPSKPALTPTPAQPTSSPTPEPEPTVEVNGETPHADEVSLDDDDQSLSTVEVVKILRPSVVQITTQSVALGMFTQPIPLEGVGTGIILDEEGHILTNRHVVTGAQEITVTLDTGENFPAKVIEGRDPLGRDSCAQTTVLALCDAKTDTAVIQIEAEGLTPARLGDSSALEVGEDVIAIGHALGLSGGPTVSKGVVSALGRSIESAPDPETLITVVDLIQTDASINPGNSGGPLVNDRAEVIGVNTAIIQQSQGIGFAININDAETVARHLLEDGFVNRGYMGIWTDNVTPALASRYDLPVNEGVIVTRVNPDTPAEAAGLQAGDIIVKLGDESITNSGELSKFLLAHSPDETVGLTYARGEETIITEITLGETPPPPG